jgi:hypothetical protein
MATAWWIDYIGSALLAEAEALGDGIRIIPEGTAEHIIVESNS